MANRKKLQSWQAKRADEGFTLITNSMMDSPAWRSLSSRDKDFYLYCSRWKHQAETRKESESDPQKYPRDRWTEGGDVRPSDFYINHAKAVAYGLIKSWNDATLRRCIKSLVRHGFIDYVFSGKGGTKSVFRMSDRWKNYPPDK